MAWNSVGESIPDSMSTSASSGQTLDEAFPQNAQLLPDCKADLAAEDVILAFGNFLQQSAVDGYQDPERRLAVFCDVGNQFLARLVKLACAIGFETEERAKARRIGRGQEIVRRQTELRQIFFRKINSAQRSILFYIADDVCELEGQTTTLGQRFSRGIAVTEDMNADQSHD